jgi:hypothetical protein
MNEWLWHTQRMLVIEWLPLTYFALSGIFAPPDPDGCRAQATSRIESLITTVYGPVLLLRFLGLTFLNRTDRIAYQILIIYGYLMVSLLIWDLNTFSLLNNSARVCFKPPKLSMINLIAMESFYMFMLIPYVSIIMVMPYYFYLVFKHAGRVRQSQLSRHYLIKALPSIIFNKKMFDENYF